MPMMHLNMFQYSVNTVIGVKCETQSYQARLGSPNKLLRNANTCDKKKRKSMQIMQLKR